jgi:very-short-patch-repair endonuclease
MLWFRLRGRGADKPTFRRQHPMGSIILDFGAVAQAILDRAREMRAGR